ncbi:hypothetical protein K505DRAFT_338522 [Melanomma pulvis-pyrius CBS 109.77]|uniref:Uncharacterized protein n=1 Tax=Melanomma pulvis-pyrius CBS 109.77 TaxID=1314802 RepID=A0A6A6X9N3_9PLEO|nr:hypothetical protein K505DRAFT_338522 [Melanomma pulvis-pyrius CBS 109.77]
MADTNSNDHVSSDAKANANVNVPGASSSAVNNASISGTGTNNTAANDPSASSAPLTVNALGIQQVPLNPGLYAPDPAAPVPGNDSIFAIATQLMNPPEDFRHVDNNFTIYITWAVGVAGPERFERTSLNHRHSLLQNDDLYLRGLEAGLSEEVREWLRYGQEKLSLPASHFGL